VLGGDGVLTTKMPPWYGGASTGARTAGARVRPAVRPVRSARTSDDEGDTRAAKNEAHRGADA
jgi:hypothetical protein